MTGFDFGPPDDPERGNELRHRVAQGALPRLSMRRVMEFEQDQGAGLGPVLGPVAAVGKGVVDANLQLLRGVQWLGIKAGALPEEGGRIPGSLTELLPDDYAMRLESRIARSPTIGGVRTRAVGEVTGQAASLLTGGGLVSKALGMPAKAVGIGAAPGRFLGEKLAQIPAVARWTRTAEALPQVLGASTGFGLVNYLQAQGDGDSRMAAATHGLMAGPVLAVLGKFASAAEAKILSRGITDAQAKALTDLNLRMAAGEIPSWSALKETAALVGVGKTGAAKGVAALVEGAGVAGLDENFWKSAVAGLQGDAEARDRALEIFLGSLPAALLARTGNPNEFLTFRRERPDLNDLNSRMQAEGVREAELLTNDPPASQGPDRPQPDQPGQGGVQMDTGRVQSVSAQAPPGLLTLSNPLLRSGWEVSTQARPDKRYVDVEFPGLGTARLGDEGGGPDGYSISMPANVYRIVRGGDADVVTDGNITLRGAAAEEFAMDLASVSAMRRMKGDLLFGNKEAWAGGPWDGDDGFLYTVGLDGNVYRRSWPAPDGEPWKKVGDREPQLQDNDLAGMPEMQRWFDLAKALHRVGPPTTGLDVMDAALVLASKGSQESRNVQELQQFLLSPWNEGISNADALATLLTPQNIDQVGFVLGQLGSGHMTALAARQALSEALLGPRTAFDKSQDPVPGTVGNQGEPIVAASAEGEMKALAGSRDWNSVDRKERRAAAEQFVTKARESGSEVAPSALRDTFAIPMSTARGIIDRSSEAGFVQLPTGKEVAELGKRIDRSQLSPRKFYERMTKAVARSGPAGQDVANRALRVIDETKQNLGTLGRMTEKTLRETVGVSLRETFGVGRSPSQKGNSEATKWAETIDWNGAYGEVRWKQALEGKPVAEAPAQLREWTDTYRKTRRQTGLMAQEAGTMRRNGRGEMEPFIASPEEANIYIRQADDRFVDLMRSGGPKMREVAELIATYGRNQIDPEALVSEWSAQAKATDRKEAFEFVRTLPDMPSHVRLSDGEIVPVLESRPHQTIKRMVEGSAARAPFIKHVGQSGVPSEVSQKPGAKGLLDALLKEGGDVRQAEYLLQSLQNATPDTVFSPGALRKPITMMHTALLQTSALLDFVEPLGTLPQFVGWKSAVRGLVDAFGSWGATKKYLEDIGALTIEAGHHLMIEGTGWAGWVTQKLGLPKQLASDFAAVWAGAAALASWRQIPDATPRYRARMEEALAQLEFSTPQIARIMTGQADEAMRRTFVRRVVASATGQLLRGERSVAGASQAFNTLLPLNKYWMNRFAQRMGSIKAMREALLDKGLTRQQRFAKVSKALNDLSGALAAGLIGLYIKLALMDGPIDAADAVATELMDAPLTYLNKAQNTSWLGGLPRNVYDLAANDSLPWAERLNRAMPQVPMFITEAWKAAIGDGPYKNETAVEAFGTLLARTLPILKKMDFVAGWMGYPVDSDMEGALGQLNDWKQTAEVPMTIRGGEKEPGEIAAWRAMAKVSRMVVSRAQDTPVDQLSRDPEIRAAVREALGEGSGESMADALRGRKVLTKLTAEQLGDLMAKKGDNVVSRLRAHDDALDRIADTYRKVPRNVDTANAALQADFDGLLKTAQGAATAGQASGFRQAIDRIEEVWDARRLAGMDMPVDEIRRLSSLIADHPEVARDLFTGKDQLRMLEMATPAFRPSLVERLLRQRLIARRPVSIERAEAK